MMSERKESSVLFSLRELHTIEEERIQEEADAVTRAEQAAIAAKEANEQQVRAEEEARRQAAEKAESDAREAAEQRQREEQMRLEESERRARIDAQAAIEQQRLAKEMELRHMEAKRKKPAWIIAAIGVVIVVAGLGVVFKIVADNRSEAKRAEVARKLEIVKIQKQSKLVEIEIDNINTEMDKAFKDLQEAQSEGDRAKAIARQKQLKLDMIAKKAEVKLLREKAANVAKAKARAKRKRDKATIARCAKSNDPLCGL